MYRDLHHAFRGSIGVSGSLVVGLGARGGDDASLIDCEYMIFMC